MGGIKDLPSPTHPPEEARTYSIFFLQALHDSACPVGGCLGRATIHSALWVNFVHCHESNTVVILEDGIHPFPRFPKCDMFVTCMALNFKHQSTSMCSRGEARSWKQQWEEEMRRIIAVAFQDYWRPL